LGAEREEGCEVRQCRASSNAQVAVIAGGNCLGPFAGLLQTGDDA